MHLTQLNVNNFRCLKEFTLKLNSGLNLLIGENNAGKTSVIDAIKTVLDTTSAEWVSLQATDFSVGENKLLITLKFDGLSKNEAGIFLEHLSNEEVSDAVNKSVLL